MCSFANSKDDKKRSTVPTQECMADGSGSVAVIHQFLGSHSMAWPQGSPGRSTTRPKAGMLESIATLLFGALAVSQHGRKSVDSRYNAQAHRVYRGYPWA